MTATSRHPLADATSLSCRRWSLAHGASACKPFLRDRTVGTEDAFRRGNANVDSLASGKSLGGLAKLRARRGSTKTDHRTWGRKSSPVVLAESRRSRRSPRGELGWVTRVDSTRGPTSRVAGSTARTSVEVPGRASGLDGAVIRRTRVADRPAGRFFSRGLGIGAGHGVLLDGTSRQGRGPACPGGARAGPTAFTFFQSPIMATECGRGCGGCFGRAG